LNALRLKPAPLHIAIPIFAGTSLLFFVALHVVLPALRNRGLSWFTIYNLVLALPMLLLVCAALAAYALEGRSFAWDVVCSWLLWHTGSVLRQIPLHSEPDALRKFLSQFGSTSLWAFH